MSDSVDRVFVHALATVRRLPRTGSSRPPPASRLRLYGLYKQSMEGDVLAILPRPTLPISSPDPNSGNNNAVHRYASRDVRTREAYAEIEKWDAWHACAGMSRTEAKREYITTLIETMKEYASGTAESRELVSELEFVWNQIRSQSGSGSDPDQDEIDRSQGKQSPEGRKSSSAGKSQSGSRQSLGSIDPGGGRSSSGNLDRSESARKQDSQQQQRRPSRPKRTQSGLRVLSPVSQGNSDSINSPVDAEEEDSANEIDDQNHDRQPSPSNGPNEPNSSTSLTLDDLQKTLESHIHTLRTELAALREQLSANHLLSSSTYSLGHHYYSLTPTQRFFHRVKVYTRVLGALFLRQVLVQLGILSLVVLWGRIRGDRRIEQRVRGVMKEWWGRIGRWGSALGWWVLEVFSRDGKLGTVGRWLRIL